MLKKEKAPELPSKYVTKVRPPYFFYFLAILVLAGGYYFYEHKTEIINYFNKGTYYEIDENGNEVPVDNNELEKITIAKDKYIYFYETSKGRVEYSFEEPGENRVLVSKYECTYNECEVFPLAFNETLYPIKDGRTYFLYNHETSSIDSPKSTFKIISRMYDSDTKELTGYLLYHKGKYGFLIDKVTIKPAYNSVDNITSIDEESSEFINETFHNKLIFGLGNENYRTIDVVTGKFLFNNSAKYITGSNDNTLYLLERVVNTKTSKTTYFLYDIDGKTKYLNKSSYENIYVRDKDNVLVVKNNQFQTENIYGKIYYTSPEYKEIFAIYDKYIIVNDNGFLYILDDNNSLKVEVKRLAINEKYIANEEEYISGIYNNEIILYTKKDDKYLKYIYKLDQLTSTNTSS